MQKKLKFLLPRMLQDKYRNCCKILAFFLQIGLHFSCIFLAFFCISILAIKMDLHFLHYFCIFLHPDFWGSIFQLHLFCIFLHLYLLLCFPERGSSPTTQASVVLAKKKKYGEKLRRLRRFGQICFLETSQIPRKMGRLAGCPPAASSCWQLLDTKCFSDLAT